MKITLKLPVELIRRAKATAAQRGQSLKQLVTFALELELAGPAPGTKNSKHPHTQAEIKATMRELKKISKRISAVWPEGVSAVDAIREQRRDL